MIWRKSLTEETTVIRDIISKPLNSPAFLLMVKATRKPAFVAGQRRKWAADRFYG